MALVAKSASVLLPNQKEVSTNFDELGTWTTDCQAPSLQEDIPWKYGINIACWGISEVDDHDEGNPFDNLHAFESVGSRRKPSTKEFHVL